MEKLISRKAAAGILGMSLERLDEARRCGRIAYIQYVENGSVYFTESALEEYVTNCTHQTHQIPQATLRKRRSSKW